MQMSRVWRLEVEMSIGTNVWKNHTDIIQIGSAAEAVPGPSDPIITDVEQWFLDNHYSDVHLNTATLRVINAKMGPPPHPETPPIWEEAINLPGSAESLYGGAHNANYLPKDVSIFVKKNTTGGRSGKMFLRNILTEVDVVSTLGGGWVFSSGAGHFDIAVFDNHITSKLGPYFLGGSSSGDYRLAVMHLEHILPADTRTPYATQATNWLGQRPVWNKAHR